MRTGKLKKLLKLWETNNLISAEQTSKITEFMKERSKQNFFKMLKWFSIIGILWLVFGIIMTVANLIHLFDYFAKFFGIIANFILNVIVFINYTFIYPLNDFLETIFGAKYPCFIWGTVCFALFAVAFFLTEKQKQENNIDKLNLTNEQKYILKTDFALEMFSVISLGAGFMLYHTLTAPERFSEDVPIIPFWLITGAASFILLAYKYAKNLYLIAGIYFISICTGMFTGCGYAAYFLAVTKPVIQILTGVILLLAGVITEMKAKEEDFTAEKFSTVYYVTGMLFVFTALWVASFWGFNITGDFDSSGAEIFFANVLFIGSALGAMYAGVKTERNLFFNFGLTFLIIETYTIIIGRIFTSVHVGIASLILGAALIITAKILKKLYFNKKVKEICNKTESGNDNK